MSWLNRKVPSEVLDLGSNYNYGQTFSSTRAMSPELLRSLFQWSDDKEEVNDYASSANVSSGQTWIVSVNIVDNNHNDDLCRRMEAQEHFQSSASNSG